jgi:phosphohistidine phosphatase SixA
MPLILVRHAWAGKRGTWDDDSERPLDERGEQQAQELVERLASYPIDEILTSPFTRCVQTVVPLAAARGLEPILRHELGEEQQWRDGAALVRALAGRDVVVCGHGGLEAALVDPPKWRKSAAFVVDGELRIVETV